MTSILKVMSTWINRPPRLFHWEGTAGINKPWFLNPGLTLGLSEHGVSGDPISSPSIPI